MEGPRSVREQEDQDQDAPALLTPGEEETAKKNLKTKLKEFKEARGSRGSSSGLQPSHRLLPTPSHTPPGHHPPCPGPSQPRFKNHQFHEIPTTDGKVIEVCPPGQTLY